MAITIPIWPGSSSFTTGSTPFGFFDEDATFVAQADKVATWCAIRLGYPINDIELQECHFYACFEEAILEYSNQVNQFAIRDNMFLLQGMSTGSNLTGTPINGTLDRLIAVSRHYGTEAGSGGYLKYKTASIQIEQGKQIYNISDFSFEEATDNVKHIEVRKMFHDTPPAIVRYFDPFVGTGMGSQQMLESFGWGGMSPAVTYLMMPMYADLLRLQAIEFNDIIRKSAYSFEITGDRLRIFPVPQYGYKLYMDYITTEDRSALNSLYDISGSTSGSSVVGDMSNAPYQLHSYTAINAPGKQWIYKYCLALAKEVLGNIRNKYTSIPIPNSETTLNGADLVAQAQTEKETLITQLRENLEATSRQSQIAKSSEEAENIQTQLNKIPLGIYIGALIPFLILFIL